jgi:hypothetical protein
MIAIQPRKSVVINPKTGAAYTAVSFSVKYSVNKGAMLGAMPTFFDAAGNALPSGAIRLLPVTGQTPQQLQMAESADIARACSELPMVHVDQAAAPVVVISRGVVLA